MKFSLDNTYQFYEVNFKFAGGFSKIERCIFIKHLLLYVEIKTATEILM